MSIHSFVVPFALPLLKSQRQLALDDLAFRQEVARLRQSVSRHRVTVYGWPNPYPLPTPETTKQPDALDDRRQAIHSKPLQGLLRRRVAGIVGGNWSFYPGVGPHTFSEPCYISAREI